MPSQVIQFGLSVPGAWTRCTQSCKRSFAWYALSIQLCRSWGSHHGWLSCQQPSRPKIEAKHHTYATGTSLHQQVPATWDAVMRNTLSSILTDVMGLQTQRGCVEVQMRFNGAARANDQPLTTMTNQAPRRTALLFACLSRAGLDFVSTNHRSQSAPSPTLWFAGIAFGNRTSCPLELETRNQTFRPDSRNPANAIMGNSSCSRLCSAAMRWTCFSYLSSASTSRARTEAKCEPSMGVAEFGSDPIANVLCLLQMHPA